MKMIAAVPFAVLILGLVACTEHAAAPAVARPAASTAAPAPAPAAGDTNTFGESRDEAAGSAAGARDANYGSDAASSSDKAAQSTPPK